MKNKLLYFKNYKQCRETEPLAANNYDTFFHKGAFLIKESRLEFVLYVDDNEDAKDRFMGIFENNPYIAIGPVKDLTNVVVLKSDRGVEFGTPFQINVYYPFQMLEIKNIRVTVINGDVVYQKNYLAPEGLPNLLQWQIFFSVFYDHSDEAHKKAWQEWEHCTNSTLITRRHLTARKS